MDILCVARDSKKCYTIRVCPRNGSVKERKEHLMKNLEGKIALVTGAGRGIGLLPLDVGVKP